MNKKNLCKNSTEKKFKHQLGVISVTNLVTSQENAEAKGPWRQRTSKHDIIRKAKTKF